MLKTLLIAGVLSLASFAVQADECLYPFDETVAAMAQGGLPVVVIAHEHIPELTEAVGGGVEGMEVTRAFLVDTGVSILLGLEVHGCLLPPIKISASKPTSRNSA